MKRILFVIWLLTLVCFSGHTQSTRDEKTVTLLCKQKFQWMINGKVDSLATALDDGLKFIHSNAWIQTKQEVLNDLQSKKLVYQTIDLQELNARGFKNTVIMTGKGSFAGTLNGNPFALNLLFTEVYVMQAKSWRLVLRQATRIP